MEEIDFDIDSFGDIIDKDPRYNARAYALLMDCVHTLSKDGRSFSAEDIMEEFKESAIEQYGPLTYTVLTEWGLSCTEDLGEMMFNLSETPRIKRGKNDNRESFMGGYDFKETFLTPYQA